MKIDFSAIVLASIMEESPLTGQIIISSRGVGYFRLEKDTQDLEIQHENLNFALNGDTVEILEIPQGALPRPQAKVKKIIKRAKTHFVGTLVNTNGKDFSFLKADDRRMYRDIFIHSSKARGGQNGDKVLVKMTSWKDPLKSPEGEVIKVLGKKGIHNVEMEAILIESGFDSTFPPEIEREAEMVAKKEKRRFEEETKNRRDMRQTLTFTIDPADAKDFDDALSIKELGNNEYEIGIHIADVSHYVREKSVLDKEAQKRGTSVYLVDRTIPMLPEVLSNDLCSLNPKVDRLTFSAIFKLDRNGKVSERWFGRTIIHSDKRFTYEEAQEILDKKEGLHYAELDILNKIAKILQKEKYESGAIEFETEEIKFELDAEGKPLRVFRKERKDTHKLIEEFMLLANREVAKYMNTEGIKIGHKGVFVYRIHDLPDPDKIQNLKIFLKALNYELKTNKDGSVSATELNKLMKEVDGTPEESLIKTATIRSMSKAIYSTRNIGHFGLGFAFYTHFTSPIRRYPDLLVHRLLDRLLKKGAVEQGEFAKYEALAIDASEKEIAAADAERASIKYKQVEFMLDKTGQEFTATISGISEWGIFVEENETHAEGMIRLKTMTDDFYELNEKNYSLVGKETKKKYSLGDEVKVKLVSADLDKRMLDFILT